MSLSVIIYCFFQLSFDTFSLLSPFKSQIYMTHYFPLCLSVISTCWPSLRGPITWISRSTAKVSCRVSVNTHSLPLKCCPPPSLPPHYFRLSPRNAFIYNSLFSRVQSCITCDLFLLYVCVALGTLNCQRSHHTVKPSCPT